MSGKSSDVMAIVELFEQSDWDELSLDMDGIQLFLSRRGDAQSAFTGRGAVEATRPRPASVSSATAASGAASGKAAPAAASDPVPDHWLAVNAPNLGTFYRAPKPGSAPFVEIGQMVEPGDEVCLLEVMKLFTSVTAGVAGKIVKMCVADAEMVEHGQPLFYIEP